MIKYTKEDVTKSNNDALSCSGFDEGSYYCEIIEVRDGNRPNSYGVCFKEVTSEKIICWDNLTFEGLGLGYANRKIQCIDPDFKIDKPYDEQKLVGKRVTLLLEKQTYNGRTSLRPKKNSTNFGYTADDSDVTF